MIFIPVLIEGKSPVHVRVDPSHVLRTFDPSVALGGAIDGHEKGEIDTIFKPANVKAMLRAGLSPVSYRLRTELAGEAWHWNPQGTWSDPQHQQGYWTSSEVPGRAITKSYGYRLPRRGNTIDQAGNDNYSRITDGDASTFWKSNPYLDTTRYGAFKYLPPEWVVLDFGKRTQLNQVRIDWGFPHADRISLQTWKGEDDAEQSEGKWEDVGEKQDDKDGTQWFSFKSRSTRYLRLVLEKDVIGRHPSGDWRDSAGFAIREIYAGTTSQGHFHDAVRHAPSASKQTAVSVSSTDPWHRAIDIDYRVEQPGFDLFFKSGITRGLPPMLPIPALYDTPENVAAEVRWIRKRGYPISGFEVGEEPDGQSVWPEHFAYLYTKMVDEIRREFPKVPIGGPSFQTVADDFRLVPDTKGAWLPRFLHELKSLHHEQDFNFGSFEWYPFDDVVSAPEKQLLTTAKEMRQQVRRLKSLGLPADWDITEYGYSAFGAQAEVDLPGAVFNIDSSMTALELGCRTSYLYGYEPNELINEVGKAWGNNMILHNYNGAVRPTPTFYSAQLLTRVACGTTGPHRLMRCNVDSEAVGAYAIQRPDKIVSLILVNRTSKGLTVQPTGTFSKRWSYGPDQYRWRAQGENGHATRNNPPALSMWKGGDLALPPYGIAILQSR